MRSRGPAAPGARHGCRSCHRPLASHRDTHGFVLFSSRRRQARLRSPWLWWPRSGMDISREHGGAAASSQVMENWSDPEHPPGVRPLLRPTWTFGLHRKLFIFPFQRSLGALMESVFSSLPGSPSAAQGMLRQPRAAWARLPAGRSSSGARPVPCQDHWPWRVTGCDRSQRDREVEQEVGTHPGVLPHLPFHLPAPFPALSGWHGQRANPSGCGEPEPNGG